jgi:hypothetical protein
VTEVSVKRNLVGTARVPSTRHETNGYLFWGLLTLWIGIPELLAGIKWTRQHLNLPWPTISSLVGKDLESHHHWVALIVVWLIAFVVVRPLTYPSEQKTLGYAAGGAGVVPAGFGLLYILLTAVAGIAAGSIAAAAGANENHLGYAIYVTLAVFGIVVPNVFAHLSGKVLAFPTLFATLALLSRRRHGHWIAAAVASLLFVLTFHLALYPWPNYHFGVP